MQDIVFQFNVLKTTQVACMFLEMHGGKMSSLHLLKLMYIADRKALTQIDYSLSGDKYYSASFGPMMLNTYTLIKNTPVPPELRTWGNLIWRKHISCQFTYSDAPLELIEGSDYSELSDEEEKIIELVYEEHKDNKYFSLDTMHKNFPEWKHPKQYEIEPIKVIDLLKVLGKTEKEISYIWGLVNRENYLNEILTK